MHSRRMLLARGHGCGAAIGGPAGIPEQEGARCVDRRIPAWMADGRGRPGRLTEMRGSIAAGVLACCGARRLRCSPAATPTSTRALALALALDAGNAVAACVSAGAAR